MSKKKVSLGVVVTLFASLLLPVLAAVPAVAAVPVQMTFDNRGCSLPATYTPGPPFPVCLDSDYTNGNLGKGWNELDLVPFRMTAVVKNNNPAPATQTYTIAVAVDSEDAGAPGYDFLSPLRLNNLLSDASCDATPTDTGELFLTPGIGGIDETRYRLVTITQLKNTTCVYDYFARLAVGSHLFPGSSLHTNLANENGGTQGIGAEDISIPVKEILPQVLDKSMEASQDSDHMWTVDKDAAPAQLNFGDVCDPDVPASMSTEITITWDKLDATGSDITVHTLVEATNPAARVIRVKVTDELFSDTTLLETHDNGLGTLVPANAMGFDVLEYTTTVPDGTDLLNDIATAEYIDDLTGVPVPGQTTATASADVVIDDVTNAEATITDSESITGAGLSFSVAAPSVGSFTNYTAGDVAVVGDTVEWDSGTQSDDGSVTFTKTVYLDASLGATSGTLDDTATLTGSDGFPASANATVEIDSSLSGSLVINKTTSVPVDGETIFEFEVNPGGIPVTVTIPDGGTSGSSDPVTGLTANDYTVTETNSNGFTPAPDQNFTIGAGACTAELDFENTFGPASLQAFKVTVPAGAEEGWEFAVTLDGNPFDTGTTDATGTVQWVGSGSDTLTIADEGEYVVTETEQAGYKSDGGKGTVGGVPQDNCTFTVDFPANADEVYTCTFTNTKLANAEVIKVTDPAGNEAGWTFKLFKDEAPSGQGPEDTEVATAVTTGSGAINFGVDLDEGDYYVLETDGPAGFESDGGDAGCTFTVAFPAAADQTFTCTFTNTENGSIEIRKVTDPSPDTTDTSFEFTRDFGTSPVSLKDGGSDLVGNLAPGTYSVAETEPTGWTLTSFTCSDGSEPDAIDLAAGENVICTATNTLQTGRIIVEKVTDPTGSTQDFEFDTNYGANFFLADGESDNSGPLSVLGSPYSVAEINIPAGWTLESFTCDNGDDPSAITLTSGDVVTCTATNEQAGKIRVAKTVSGASGNQSFTFELRQGAIDSNPGTGDDTPGTLLDTKTINADNTFVQLNSFLAPGTYQVCELLPSAGWATNLGPNQFTLTLGGDNSRVCIDVEVEAGDVIDLQVDNTPPPGGGQLTIGFWKNHATCKTSGGNQAPVLDQVLATFPIASGQTTPGFFAGTLYIDTCNEAVKLLNKTPITGGKKVASDPAFNMVAQFVAASLNIQAGAGTCPAINTAMDQARALLTAIGFNGVSPTAMTAAQKAQANSLNTTLDQYNNGLLC